MHGAGTKKRVADGTRKPPGRPPSVGRYAVKTKQQLSEKVEAFRAHPTPGDLSEELALMRALIDYHLENTSNLTGYQIDRIVALLGQVAHTVERINRIMAKTALTQAELHYLQVGIGDLINRYLADPADRAAFLGELRQLTTIPDRG
jgi:hypothetical protein